MSNSNPNPQPSVIHTLGLEIVRIIAPVSACMLIVVLLVTSLHSDSPLSMNSIGTIVYSESDTDSTWDKFKGAVFNSLAFVSIITIATFLLVLLFYFRLTSFLKYYMGFSSFIVLAFIGGEVFMLLISRFNVAIDVVTFLVLLFNFAMVGVASVYWGKMPIIVIQTYLVVIGVLVAFCFTMLPEWTTWSLLIAMSLYDLAAVLLPGGPLRLLVEMAISRDEEIPALIYEARPIEASEESNTSRRLWRERRRVSEEIPISVSSDSANTRLIIADDSSDIQTPLVNRHNEVEEEEDGGIGLGSSGAIKLGLGDFIFYSVLVGRAALYDYMAVYACYLAIIAGLGITLLLLAFYRKALPALPVSVMLGVLFYFLTRMLLEVFVVQCSTNLLMF